MLTPTRASAFTRTELVLALAAVLLILSVLIPSLRRADSNTRHIGAQKLLSTTGRAMLQWSSDHAGALPLPSQLDTDDATVPGPPRAKDTSANIMSVLIFNHLITPEALVDPSERANIRPHSAYAHTNPPAALNPDRALWDPSFNADFTGDASSPGNLSWAHLQPAGSRLAKWSSALRASTPLLASRGPQIAGIDTTRDGPRARWANTRSLHLRGGAWEGGVFFGDGHTEHLRTVFIRGSTQRNGAPEPPDALFFDEPEDTNAANDFLGIFTRAGETPPDFHAIWD